MSSSSLMRCFKEMNQWRVLKGIREIHTPAPPLPTLRAPRVHFVTINIWPRQISFDVCCVWTAHSEAFLPPPSRPPLLTFIPRGAMEAITTAFLMHVRIDGSCEGDFLESPEHGTHHNNTSPDGLNLIYFSSFLQRWLLSVPPSSPAVKRRARHPSASVKW